MKTTILILLLCGGTALGQTGDTLGGSGQQNDFIPVGTKATPRNKKAAGESYNDVAVTPGKSAGAATRRNEQALRIRNTTRASASADKILVSHDISVIEDSPRRTTRPAVKTRRDEQVNRVRQPRHTPADKSTTGLSANTTGAITIPSSTSDTVGMPAGR